MDSGVLIYIILFILFAIPAGGEVDVVDLPMWAQSMVKSQGRVVEIEPCGKGCYEILSWTPPDSMSRRIVRISGASDIMGSKRVGSWIQPETKNSKELVRVYSPVSVVDGFDVIEATHLLICPEDKIVAIRSVDGFCFSKTGKWEWGTLPNEVEVDLKSINGKSHYLSLRKNDNGQWVEP